MIEALRNLGGKKAPTAAALKSALASIDFSDLDAAVQAAEADLNAKRLTADEVQLDALEARVAAARRERDRARAAAEEIERRIVEADAAEAKAAKAKERADLEKEVEAAAKDVAAIYSKASADIIAALERLADVDARVRAFNARQLAQTAIDPLPIIGEAEGRAFPQAPSSLSGKLTVLKATSLVPVAGSTGWGEAKRLARFA